MEYCSLICLLSGKIHVSEQPKTKNQHLVVMRLPHTGKGNIGPEDTRFVVKGN